MRKKDELTEKQILVLDFIKTHIREYGYPPTVRDICNHIGLKSTSTAHGYLDRLEKKGLIRRDPTLPRAIEVLDAESESDYEISNVPLIGSVAAGQPILAEQNIEEYIPLPERMIRHRETFLLRVKGESMKDIGILDGDLILVRRQNTAEDGEVVVAMVSGETESTVKRFYREGDHFRLQPENSSMDPIIVDQVDIAGIVIGLIRSFE